MGPGTVCAELAQELGELARAGALDLHEEISHPPCSDVPGCPRWPEHLRLLSSDGEIVRGRCGSTNQCGYCARLAAVENSEVLALDAMRGNAPQVWCVLTTRDAEPDPARFYRSRELLVRALRRRWPDCEYAALVEFTTGYGPRSGGLRRPHWNLLLKGIPAEDVEAVREVVVAVWCARENAEPRAQHVGRISDAGGLMRYIALHFLKESQAPPPGWRGHRFLKSRGYLSRPTSLAREQARDALRLKRELWRARGQGLEGSAAERRAQEAVERAKALTWRIYRMPAACPGSAAALAPRSGGSAAPPRPPSLLVLERAGNPPSWSPEDARTPT